MHVGNCRETRLLVFLADFFFLTFPCKTCKVPIENSRKRSTCKTSIPECLCVLATDSHACTILPSSLYPVQGFSFSVFPFFILALPIAPLLSSLERFDTSSAHKDTFKRVVVPGRPCVFCPPSMSCFLGPLWDFSLTVQSSDSFSKYSTSSESSV